jgi:glycogen debranching enzyme
MDDATGYGVASLADSTSSRPVWFQRAAAAGSEGLTLIELDPEPEPEPPLEPRGCPFQAWGVAEVLRVWRALGGD